MRSKRRTFELAFKREAVELSCRSDTTQKRVAEEARHLAQPAVQVAAGIAGRNVPADVRRRRNDVRPIDHFPRALTSCCILLADVRIQHGTTRPTKHSVNPIYVIAPLPCENLPARTASETMHFKPDSNLEQFTVPSTSSASFCELCQPV